MFISALAPWHWHMFRWNRVQQSSLSQNCWRILWPTYHKHV